MDNRNPHAFLESSRFALIEMLDLPGYPFLLQSELGLSVPVQPVHEEDLPAEGLLEEAVLDGGGGP
ncbi:MAG TPA: hypothetical protein VLB09_09885, partial [Nitrospiria bacterium]|nr:hypothetical protein [Nitrospiria bacterium]